MSRNEEVVRHDVLAAGPGEPHRVPVVVDPGILAWHQKKARLCRLGGADRWDHRGEKVPLCIVATASEAPHSGGPVTAVGCHRLADRRIGSRGNGPGIGPKFLLGLFWKA